MQPNISNTIFFFFCIGDPNSASSCIWSERDPACPHASVWNYSRIRFSYHCLKWKIPCCNQDIVTASSESPRKGREGGKGETEWKKQKNNIKENLNPGTASKRLQFLSQDRIALLPHGTCTINVCLLNSFTPHEELFFVIQIDKNEWKVSIINFPRMQGRLAQRRERSVDFRPCITYPKFLRKSNMSPDKTNTIGQLGNWSSHQWLLIFISSQHIFCV